MKKYVLNVATRANSGMLPIGSIIIERNNDKVYFPSECFENGKWSVKKAIEIGICFHEGHELSGIISLLQKGTSSSPKNDESSFLTIAETACYMRITRQTLTRHCRNGKIEFKRAGKKYLFSKEEINRFLSS